MISFCFMKKKEFKVGEEFQFGLIRLRVEDGTGMMCHRCFFNEIEEIDGTDYFVERCVGSCLDSDRSDGKHVIFVEVKED